MNSWFVPNDGWFGHFVPGLILAIFGLWWHINNCIRYIKSKEKQIKFEGSTTYPCFCLSYQVYRRLPIESITKIIIASIDMTTRIYNGYRSLPKPHIDAIFAVHIPMLLGFFIGGWVEILIDYYKFPLPKCLTQVMAAIAFYMEGLVIMLHPHGESLLEGHMHRLLGVTITGSVIAAIGECFSPNNFSLIVARSFFLFTQGTLFIQASFILWSPIPNPYFTWKQDSHESVSYATMCYAYQLAFNSILLLILYLVIYKFVSHSNKLNQIDDDYQDEGYKLIIDENNEDI